MAPTVRSAPPSRPIGKGWVGADGDLAESAEVTLEDLWRKVVAGHVNVPVVITGTNVLTLTALRHEEGTRDLDDYMVFIGVAEMDSTGAVTAIVGENPAIKVYKDGGATQAGSGDVLANRLYLFIYNSALDGGAGGLVLK